MSNPFEALVNVMKSLIDNEPKPPMHVGEVMSCWTYITMLEEAIRFEEAGLNTTDDNDIKKMLQDGIKLCSSQARRLREFLKHEGVPLPNTEPPKPRSDSKDIPMGVKLSDSELANGLSIKIATSNVECAVAQSQAIRYDIGLMWVEFQTEILTFAATLRRLMKKRGWLKTPPYYYPSGLPRGKEK